MKLDLKKKKKEEAFRERRHLHVCDLWPCGVTLTFCVGKKNWYHKMSLIVLYLLQYDVYGSNTFNISPFYLTFHLHMWPSTFVLMGCNLIPSMKSVGEIASEIWPVLCFSTLFFYLFWGKFDLWPWPEDQGHRHLGYSMRLLGLYLHTKYEVCRWNSIWGMASYLVFIHFFENLTLTLK